MFANAIGNIIRAGLINRFGRQVTFQINRNINNLLLPNQKNCIDGYSKDNRITNLGADNLILINETAYINPDNQEKFLERATRSFQKVFYHPSGHPFDSIGRDVSNKFDNFIVAHNRSIDIDGLPVYIGRLDGVEHISWRNHILFLEHLDRSRRLGSKSICFTDEDINHKTLEDITTEIPEYRDVYQHAKDSGKIMHITILDGVCTSLNRQFAWDGSTFSC